MKKSAEPNQNKVFLNEDVKTNKVDYVNCSNKWTGGLGHAWMDKMKIGEIMENKMGHQHPPWWWC